jgi:hypothetical protein
LHSEHEDALEEDDDLNNDIQSISSKAKSVSSLSSERASHQSAESSSEFDGNRSYNEDALPPPPADLTSPADDEVEVEEEHTLTDDEHQRPPSYKDVIEGNTTQPTENSEPTTANDLPSLNSSENTLEIYDFDPEKLVEIFEFDTKLKDFEIAKDLVKYRGISLSKVDDKHYLCDLPTSDAANNLLQEEFPNFSVRSIDQASKRTKEVAQAKYEESTSC